MEFAINTYEEIDFINVLDTGVINLDKDLVESVIDIALEIVYRRKENLPDEKFLERLDELLGDCV